MIAKRLGRFYDTSRFAQPQIRTHQRKARGNKGPTYLLTRGGRDQRFEVFHAEDRLEIGGVNGSTEAWREILARRKPLRDGPTARQSKRAPIGGVKVVGFPRPVRPPLLAPES